MKTTDNYDVLQCVDDNYTRYDIQRTKLPEEDNKNIGEILKENENKYNIQDKTLEIEEKAIQPCIKRINIKKLKY